MVPYKVDWEIRSPGRYTTFIEFSPDARFLAVGYRGFPLLCLLDSTDEYNPRLSISTLENPTALVWETPCAFYVGLTDGRFTYYRVDPEGDKLITGPTNHFFHGVFPKFPITAMGLDVDSKTLVLSVGPEVFAFRRIRATSEFCFISKILSRFNFPREPGRPTPPFPKVISFNAQNTLIITFCRQNIISTTLEFLRDPRLGPLFRTGEIDYSGLPLLNAITSAGGEKRLTRCWIYGRALPSDGDEHRFLFINGGAATLSCSRAETAIIRDTVTQREIQRLEHTGTTDRQVSLMAYHVSNDKYIIATVSSTEYPTINVWSAQRTSHPPGRPDGFLTPKGLIAVTLAVLSIIIIQRQVESVPNVDEISRFVSQIELLFAQLCIQIGRTIVETAEDIALGLEDALG